MLAEISSLVSSLAHAKNLGSALLDERDRQKAAAIQIDLTNQIVQAQGQLSQVLGAIIEKDGAIQTLTQRVRELEAQQAEKARYRLAKVGTLGNFFAYELRPAAELVERSDEPPHFVCQPCFDAGKKSVLHQRDTIIKCYVCDNAAIINPGSGSSRGVVSRGVSPQSF